MSSAEGPRDDRPRIRILVEGSALASNNSTNKNWGKPSINEVLLL